MIKRALMAIFFQTRGSPAFPKVQSLLDNLTEAEALEMHRFLQNLKEDAASAGARDGARQPWRHGGYGG